MRSFIKNAIITTFYIKKSIIKHLTSGREPKNIAGEVTKPVFSKDKNPEEVNQKVIEKNQVINQILLVLFRVQRLWF